MASNNKHILFILVSGPTRSRADTVSEEAKAATVRILQFLSHCKPWLAKMQIGVEIKQIKLGLAKDPRLKQTLQEKGITEFPALKTRRRVYVGVKNIATVYSKVIESFKEASRKTGQAQLSKTDQAIYRRGEMNPSGASAEDIYRSYYKDDLTFWAAEHDQEDNAMGSADTMMSSFHSMMKRRQETEEKRVDRPQAFLDRPGISKKGPPRKGTASKADNLAEDELIDRLISTVSNPVTQETLDRAFGSVQGSEDAREDVMVASFWENQRESI